jgi:hypothetical protein
MNHREEGRLQRNRRTLLLSLGIENLIRAKVVTKEDLKEAIDTFEYEIRYEGDSAARKNSWDLVKFLRTFSENAFGIYLPRVNFFYRKTDCRFELKQMLWMRAYQ